MYIWARWNPDVRLSFLGLLFFAAPDLPWLVLCFSLLFYNKLPIDDLLGIVVGQGTSSHILSTGVIWGGWVGGWIDDRLFLCRLALLILNMYGGG